MADFSQAIKWMKEGKKVRRPEYKFFVFNNGCCLMYADLNIYWESRFEDFEATDWEIYRKEISFNDISKEKRKYIESRVDIPNTIRLCKKVVDKFHSPIEILGMMVVIDETIEGDNFILSYEKIETDINKGKFYQTLDGKYLYIHEITYWNQIAYANKSPIVSIVTGEKTKFRGDARTVVFRKVFNEAEFRSEVRLKC